MSARGYRPENVTDHQRRCWDALHRHRNVRTAALELGINGYSLRDACEAYMRHMGLSGPLPFVKEYRQRTDARELVETRASNARLSEENARLRLTIERLEARIVDLEAMAHPWVGVHARLERIERAVSVPRVVTHRRQADGGVGGKRERKPRPMAIPA
jgi:tryptophan 2,3-dioxygenase